MQRKNTPFMQK